MSFEPTDTEELMEKLAKTKFKRSKRLLEIVLKYSGLEYDPELEKSETELEK